MNCNSPPFIQIGWELSSPGLNLTADSSNGGSPDATAPGSQLSKGDKHSDWAVNDADTVHKNVVRRRKRRYPDKASEALPVDLLGELDCLLKSQRSPANATSPSPIPTSSAFTFGSPVLSRNALNNSKLTSQVVNSAEPLCSTPVAKAKKNSSRKLNASPSTSTTPLRRSQSAEDSLLSDDSLSDSVLLAATQQFFNSGSSDKAVGHSPCTTVTKTTTLNSCSKTNLLSDFSPPFQQKPVEHSSIKSLNNVLRHPTGDGPRGVKINTKTVGQSPGAKRFTQRALSEGQFIQRPNPFSKSQKPVSTQKSAKRSRQAVIVYPKGHPRNKTPVTSISAGRTTEYSTCCHSDLNPNRTTVNLPGQVLNTATASLSFNKPVTRDLDPKPARKKANIFASFLPGDSVNSKSNSCGNSNTLNKSPISSSSTLNSTTTSTASNACANKRGRDIFSSLIQEIPANSNRKSFKKPSALTGSAFTSETDKRLNSGPDRPTSSTPRLSNYPTIPNATTVHNQQTTRTNAFFSSSIPNATNASVKSRGKNKITADKSPMIVQSFPQSTVACNRPVTTGTTISPLVNSMATTTLRSSIDECFDDSISDEVLCSLPFPAVTQENTNMPFSVISPKPVDVDTPELPDSGVSSSCSQPHVSINLLNSDSMRQQQAYHDLNCTPDMLRFIDQSQFIRPNRDKHTALKLNEFKINF